MLRSAFYKTDNEQVEIVSGLLIKVGKLPDGKEKLRIAKQEKKIEIVVKEEKKMEIDQRISGNEKRKWQNDQLIMNNRARKMEIEQSNVQNPLRPNFYFLLFTFYFFFSASTVFAQDSPSVKTTIDRTRILIGEQLRLGIDLSYPTGEPVLLPQPDTIPHFVMVGKGSVDSLVTGNTTSYHLEWKLTSFDSGSNKIPAFPIAIGNGHYYSDSLLVDVSYGDLDSAREYRDIKGIIDIENPAVGYIVWVVIALTVLSLILFIWSSTWTRQQTASPQVPKQPGLSPFDEAMASLESLKKMALTDAAAVKKYYSGMNDALRIYLSRSMGLATMERTNEELILQLSRLDMNKDFFSRLAGTLRMSDFVKFAKYIPDVHDNEQNLEVIRSAIVLINETRKI
jgi:hypothetical protein